MTEPDERLLRAYGSERSEAAFQSLVDRYLVLVYSAAMRQVGNAQLAQEIAQDVFVALARKSDSLRYGTTLSGWLYKTTLLQARHALRSELRRKRREETAIEVGSVANAESPWAPLLPMLDEAILHLREKDRTAVVLRYLEAKPIREVGTALGISEDAAQKRIAKALDGLTQFFRRRGFVVPAVTAIGTPLFSEAVKAVPFGLASTVAQFALRRASMVPISGAGLFLAKLMTMTKTQIAAVCLLVGALPAGIGWTSMNHAHAESATLQARLEQLRTDSQTAEQMIDSLTANRRSQEANLAALQQMAKAQSLATPSARPEPEFYPWIETSAYVRIPRSLVERLFIPPGLQDESGNSTGPLTDTLRALLRISPAEETWMTELLNAKSQRVKELVSQNLAPSDQRVNYRLVAPFAPPGVRRGGPGANAIIGAGSEEPLEIVSFEMKPFPEQVAAVWSEVDSSLSSILGADRTKFLMERYEGLVRRTVNPGLVGSGPRVYSYLLKGPPDAAIYLMNAPANLPQPNAGARAGARAGAGGGVVVSGRGALSPSEDLSAPESMKPILARWRAAIAATKNQTGGNQP